MDIYFICIERSKTLINTERFAIKSILVVYFKISIWCNLKINYLIIRIIYYPIITIETVSERYNIYIVLNFIVSVLELKLGFK